jgi:hypothetical protein
LAVPLLAVVLDEVELVVWVVGLAVVFCLAVWTFEGRLVTVFGPVFAFSSVMVDALKAGASFFAGAASGGAALSVDAIVCWLSLTFRSFATIVAFSG